MTTLKVRKWDIHVYAQNCSQVCIPNFASYLLSTPQAHAGGCSSSGYLHGTPAYATRPFTGSQTSYKTSTVQQPSCCISSSSTSTGKARLLFLTLASFPMRTVETLSSTKYILTGPERGAVGYMWCRVLDLCV